MTAPLHRITPAATGTRHAVLVLRAILVLASVAHVGAFVFVALSRMAYPFALEWMEGGTLDHLDRVLGGQRLYAEPTPAFAAFVYPPLYYWVAAVPASLLGTGFFPLRLVSFLAALGCIALVYVWVRKDTSRWFPAALGAGLYAAAFRPSGWWYDIARVDSLFVLLLIGTLVVLRFAGSARSFALAGVLIALAAMTKQIALAVAIPLSIYCVVFHRRRGAWFVATWVLLVTCFVIVMQLRTDGWFGFYVWEVTSRHALLPDALVAFWTEDLFRPMPIACILGVTAVWLARRENRPYELAAAAGMLAAAWAGRLHEGTYLNNLMPAYAALAALFGLGIARVSSRWPSSRAHLVLFALLLFQLGKQTYTPQKRIPTAADAAAGREIVRALRGVDGDVLIPSHGYLARKAGKSSSIHAMAVTGFVIGGPSQVTDRLLDEISRAISERRYAAIVLDADRFAGADAIADTYEPSETWLVGSDAFWPVTGFRTRPRYVWRPTR